MCMVGRCGRPDRSCDPGPSTTCEPPSGEDFSLSYRPSRACSFSLTVRGLRHPDRAVLLFALLLPNPLASSAVRGAFVLI